jgi:hypothetical protein
VRLYDTATKRTFNVQQGERRSRQPRSTRLGDLAWLRCMTTLGNPAYDLASASGLRRFSAALRLRAATGSVCEAILGHSQPPFRRRTTGLRGSAGALRTFLLPLNWLKHRGEASTGVVDGSNNRILQVARCACGFRTHEAMNSAVYDNSGRLPEPVSTHRFCGLG